MNFLEKTKITQTTKSIELKLVPEKATAESIEKDNVLDFDREFEEKLNFLAPYIDAACLEKIIEPALSEVDYNFDNLYSVIGDGKKKNEEEIKLKKTIAEAVKKALSDIGLGGKLEKIKSDAFISGVLKPYVENMPAPEDTKEKSGTAIKDEIIAKVGSLKGQLGLMDHFLNTRITAINVWMPNRVIDNFYRYIANVTKIANIDGSKIGTKVYTEYPEISRYIKPCDYRNCLTESGIEEYNRIFSGTHTDTKSVPGVIELINLHNLEARKTQGLKTYALPWLLYKQVLAPKDKAFEIEKLESLEEAIEVMDTLDFSGAEKFRTVITNNDINTDNIIVKGTNLHALSYAVYQDHEKLVGLATEKAISDINDSNMSVKKKNEAIENASKSCIKRSYTFSEINTLAGQNIFEAYKKLVGTAVENSETAIEIYKMTDKTKDTASLVEAIKNVFDTQTEIRELIRLIKRPNDGLLGDNILYNSIDEIYASMSPVFKAQTLELAFFTRKPKDIAKKKQTWLGSAGRIKTEWFNVETNPKITKNVASIVRMDDKYYYIISGPVSAPWAPVKGESAEMLNVTKFPDMSLAVLVKIAINNKT